MYPARHLFQWIMPGLIKTARMGNPARSMSVPSGVCLHSPQEGLSCDDGLECTGIQYREGTCEGDASECQCSPNFSDVVTKISALEVGASEHPERG